MKGRKDESRERRWEENVVVGEEGREKGRKGRRKGERKEGKKEGWMEVGKEGGKRNSLKEEYPMNGWSTNNKYSVRKDIPVQNTQSGRIFQCKIFGQ